MHDLQSLAKELDIIETSKSSADNSACIDPSLLGFRDLSTCFLDNAVSSLFPLLGRGHQNTEQNLHQLSEVFSKLCCLLQLPNNCDQELMASLAELKQSLIMDAQSILDGDPAAKSLNEVILCYPGFYAICVHRIAHKLETSGLSLLARFLSETAHQKTGIDIHPGAKIGSRFCIDHGTGIVIGETTVIGDDVKLYHGVTLGGLSVLKSQASKKRHPTIEDNVVIYSNAVILGGSTVIGKNSIIGGNVWLTHSIEENSIVEQEKQQLSIKLRKSI